ncbi:hypothetical protein HK100_008854 [Physocladia obscura]|uniref:Dolichyl-phosphate-mannose--protein mannosyltransferase n=1 Tax=Physocladia obscura TaxID=109957 RepID=A0AAD5TA27_9FUNG|nr:hypothetical protein HK100_008854 [Physocladia obscura]
MDLRKRKKTESFGFPLAGRTPDYRYAKVSANKTFGDVGELPDLRIIAALFVFALLIRLFRISHPHEVVFDEVHFGGFATKYINGNFFMDVHPPLGKLLFAAAGLVGGFNASFYFTNIGDDYLENHAPYVIMRLIPGLMGVMLVPVAYITMRNFGTSNIASILPALLLCLDNAFITQSRLILLDSGLLFFTGLTVMMWSDFLTCQETPFTFNWWYPLAMTGVSLGLTGSIKWVGLFLIATIGLSTIKNLWEILGDVKVSPRKFVDHFLARALCLILIPGFIYMFLFQVHFWALPNSGGGTGFMSPEFQSTLRGRGIPDTFEDVAFGSTVNIRHHATNGGYLHSHKHDYPTGSKQQQITVYPFKDDNSKFIIKYGLEVKNHTVIDRKVEKLEYLKNGDIIRLEHVATGKKLHSHDVKAPVTVNEHHWEVSGYGDENWTGDTNDNWIVRIADPNIEHDDPQKIKAINTKIRLIHVNNRHCGLFSHDKKLPEWAYEQQEVTCSENNVRAGAVWLIESNENSLCRGPGFFRKFAELHGTMWSVNSGLTSKHPYESRPIDWPVLNRGILFWTEKKSGPRQIYLIGNPLVWWTSTLTILGCAALILAGILLLKRKVPFLNDPLYFAILSIGLVFELVTHRLSRASRIVLAGVFVLIVFFVYLDLSPLAYGNLMHKHHCERIKWGKHWDWTCVTSPEDQHDIPAQVAGKVHHKVDHAAAPSPSASKAEPHVRHAVFPSHSPPALKITGSLAAAASSSPTTQPKVIPPDYRLPVPPVNSPIPIDIPAAVGDLGGVGDDDDGEDEVDALQRPPHEGEEGAPLRPPHQFPADTTSAVVSGLPNLVVSPMPTDA